MTVVPEVAAVTTPDDGSIEATEGTLLLHTPTVEVSVSNAGWPIQAEAGPPIVPGNGLTVTIADAVQPVAIA